MRRRAVAGRRSPGEMQPEEQDCRNCHGNGSETDHGDGGYSEVAQDTISSFGEKREYRISTTRRRKHRKIEQVIDNAVDGGAKLVVTNGYLFR